MLPPLPRCSDWAYSSLISPSRVSLPRKGCRVGLHIVLFEACSAFTRVAACTLALSPIRDTLYRRLQPFRHLHDCSGCFRLERLPGGACTHWKAPPFHGAHPDRTLRRGGASRWQCWLIWYPRQRRLFLPAARGAMAAFFGNGGTGGAGGKGGVLGTGGTGGTHQAGDRTFAVSDTKYRGVGKVSILF